MRCPSAVAGVMKFDIIRDCRFCERAGVLIGLGERVEQATLGWYGHVMRMDDYISEKGCSS